MTFDRAAYMREYRKANRDKINAYKAKWRADNIEVSREQSRTDAAKWRERHPEEHARRLKVYNMVNADRIADYQAQYRKENRERRNVLNKRRAQQVGKGDLTHAEWEAILSEFDHRCAYCQGQVALQIEHMTPLSRGGLHTADNVVPACQPCNSRKYTANIFEFLSR